MGGALQVALGAVIALAVGTVMVRHERRLDRRCRIYEDLLPAVVAQLERETTHRQVPGRNMHVYTDLLRSARIAGWDEYDLAVKIVNGNRSATPEIIKGLADTLNMNPYALLGPEDPKAAVRELVELYGLSAEDLFDMGEPRHPERDAA